MQSYYPPTGLLPRRRTSSTSAAPLGPPRQVIDALSSRTAGNDTTYSPKPDTRHLPPAYTGDLVESPQSQTSSNGSVLPETLHPSGRPTGKHSENASSPSPFARGNPPRTPTQVISSSSAHPRSAAAPAARALPYTPETIASERDFPTVSQNSRAPLIARDYGYADDSSRLVESAGGRTSPRVDMAGRIGTSAANGGPVRRASTYAADPSEAEYASPASTSTSPSSPRQTLPHPLNRPTLVTSRSELPNPSSARYRTSPPEEPLPLPQEGPQDAYVSQHIHPIAPLPSQHASTLPPEVGQGGGVGRSDGRGDNGSNGILDLDNSMHGSTGLNKGKAGFDSPPPPTPVFARSNTAPGIPQPSLTQPLSPGVGIGIGNSASPTLDGATNSTAQAGTDDSMPIFHILNATLDGPATHTVDMLKQHLDAVVRMQDEVCAMHLDLEGLAPLGAMKVDPTSPSVDGHTGEKGQDGSGGAGLFASKSHDPSNTRSNAPKSPTKSPTSNATKAEADSNAAEAAILISRREEGVEAIMAKLSDLSDQIRAYHHLGTPKLAFRHGGSQPVSALPGSQGSGDDINRGGGGAAIPSINTGVEAYPVHGLQSRVDAAANLLRPSPIITPTSPHPLASAGATPTTGRTDNAARSTHSAAGDLTPASPEYATRRPAALHAHTAHPPPQPHSPFADRLLSPTDRHKPKHPSHLDQVFTARRESSGAGRADMGMGEAASGSFGASGNLTSEPMEYFSRSQSRAGTGMNSSADGVQGDQGTRGAQGDQGDVSPKSAPMRAERYFGFGNDWGSRKGVGTGGVYGEANGEMNGSTGGGRGRERRDDGDKGEQSWIETR